MAVALQNQTTEYNEIAEFFQADLGVQCIATKTNKWREFYSKNLLTEWEQAEDRSNVYWTPNSFKGHNRSLSSIVQLNAFYVDLDCYKVGMTKEIALHALDMVLKDKNIFKPSMIIDSGNGLQLLWRIEGVPVRAMSIIKLWNRIEKELADRLAILGADPASTDASRVLRVPETYNTKGKELQRTKVVSFDSKAIYEMRDFQFELLPALKTKTSGKTSNKTTKKGKVSHLFNIFTLNKARLRDLETLLVLRENNPKNMRNIILFLMANFIENGSLEIDKQAYIEKVNYSLKTPLSSQEIAIIARNTDGKYNYKNETLVELLQITKKEERHMKSILSKKEYDRRHRVAERKRYEPIKQANKTKKEERNEKILAMIADGYTHAEIADELNISTKTVQRVVKSSKNKANEPVKTDEVKKVNINSKTVQRVTDQPKNEVDISSALILVYRWGGRTSKRFKRD